MKKQILSFVIILCIALNIVSAMPLSVGAATSGTCGENLTWTVVDGTLTISGTGAMTSWSIPSYRPWHSEINNVKTIVIEDGVASIGRLAFRNFSNLTSVTIPDSVTSIESNAFGSCTSLTSVTIPDSVSTMESSAFYNCTGLVSVKILGGITIIESSAFSGCTALSSVEIPDSVTRIRVNAFSGCMALTGVTVPYTVTTIDSTAFPSGDDFVIKGYKYSEAETFANNNGNTFESIGVIPYEIVTEGTCGDNLTWILDNYKVLTISGTGAMTDWSSSSKVPWYSNRKSIKTVVIEDGVSTVGDYAFYDCESLTSVTIPEEVTSIGKYAFGYCESLTSVTIPEEVTSIGEYAFYYCTSLTNVEIPDSVTSIGDYTFKYCNSLTSIEIPGSVTSIEWEAFSECSGLASVTIYEGVTRIGYKAFYNCSSLASVTIPESVTSIGDYAFSGCSSLTNVTIPDSVITIESYAFSGCMALIGVTVPYTVTTIESYAFPSGEDFVIKGYKYSEAESFANTNENTFESLADMPLEVVAEGTCGDNLTWILDNYKVLTISGTGAMTDWPSSSKAPWYSNKESIKTVVIEEGVTTIGQNTFFYCSSLTSVTIPDSVTSIGSQAFYECKNLTSITIPDSVTSIGSQAFSYCSSLTSVTIPQSVTSIGYNAFPSGEDFVVRGYTYSQAEDYAMDNKNTFESIGVVPYEVVAEGTCGDNLTWVFDSYRVITISGTGSMTDWATWGTDTPWYSERDKIRTVVIEDGVTSIGGYAFYDFDFLTSVTIPEEVTSIGEYAFGSCASLTNATIPQSVTSIGYKAFPSGEDFVVRGYTYSRAEDFANTNKNTFESIGVVPYEVVAEGTCGDNLTWILDNYKVLTISGTGAMTDWSSYSKAPWYSNGKNIRTVLIENGVTSVGNYAFYYCDSLTSVTIPDSVTTIGNYAFYDCYSLEEVTIPHSVTSIEYRAFYGCNSLKEITIPHTVTNIGGDAFRRGESFVIKGYDQSAAETFAADNSNTFESLGGIPVAEGTCGENLAWKLDANGLLTISGEGSMTDWSYASNVPWNSYKDDIKTVVIEEGVTNIGDYAFYDCTSLESVEIPGSVTSIDRSAFNSCESLTSVEIPESVKSIGKYAFCNCTSLVSAEIPESVTSIGEYAFYKCASLTSVEIPGNVTRIENNTFSNCTSLTNVTIPNSVTTIAYSAFNGCSSLTEITIPYTVTIIGSSAFPSGESLVIKGYKYSQAETFASNNQNTFESLGDMPLEVVAEGTCGDNLTWVLDNYGLLTISGTGDMTNWSYYSYVPWYSERNNIKSIVIEDGVTTIGNYAFSGCDRLTSVTIPESVTSIGERVFYNCSSLTSVTIPESVTSIEDSAFSGCSSLISITIPDGVTSIGDYAFYGCSSITSITIPESVTNIGDDAFTKTGYFNDESNWEGDMLYRGSCLISVKETVTEVTIKEGTTLIAGGALKNCESLESVTIPDGVISIGNSAFSGCESLTNVTIPESVTSIGDGAFNNCTSLTSIVIPDSVISLGEWVFCECENLESVVIGNSVTRIGNEAFYNCGSLTEVTIPESVTSIGGSAFNYCESLTDIVIGNNVTSMDDAFHDTAYYNDESNWENDVLYIGEYLIEARRTISKVSIREGTKLIARSAFRRCNNFTSIIIPDSVEYICQYAFYECSGLDSILIPKSVKVIEEGGFIYCDYLIDVYYEGSEADWKNISIGIDNEWLTDYPTIHYNSSAEDVKVKVRLKYQVYENTIWIESRHVTEDNCAFAVVFTDGVAHTMSIDLTDGGEEIKFDENDDYVKVFVWKSLESMEPLTEPVMIKVNE